MELCFYDSVKMKFHLIVGGGTLFWWKCYVNSAHSHAAGIVIHSKVY